MQLHLLAKRYDIPGYRDACLTAILALPPDQAPGVAGLNNLMAHVQSTAHARWDEVQQLCLSRLLQLFVDVSRLNDSSQMQRFLRLSFPAVLLWAAADQLQAVASDNDVLVALDSCVSVQPAEALSGSQCDLA